MTEFTVKLLWKFGVPVPKSKHKLDIYSGHKMLRTIIYLFGPLPSHVNRLVDV